MQTQREFEMFIATQQEEITYLMNPMANGLLKLKVEAKLRCFNRYNLYLHNEIADSHIVVLSLAQSKKIQ